MPQVLNKRDIYKVPDGAAYVGRPSKWGNPFVIGKDGTRREVIVKYRESIKGREDEIREELKDKDLVCWCAPEECHADVLLEIANTVL